MNLKPEKALLFLKNEYGLTMGASTLRRYKRELRTQAKERLYKIAEYGSEQEHIESIDEIEMARSLLWKEYDRAVKPLERATILEKIINTRPLLSSYYDSTKDVIERPASIQENSTIQNTPVQPTPEWS